VVEAEAVFQLAVVVFDPPADLREAGQVPLWCAFGQGGQPVVGGFGLAGGPFGQQPAGGQAPVGVTGDVPARGADA